MSIIKNYPIKIIGGTIVNVIIVHSEEHGRRFIISLETNDGEQCSLRLWFNEYKDWLNTVINEQPNLAERLYDMILTNWDRIIKHINECIKWVNDFQQTTLPKYALESHVKILNHSHLSGMESKVKDYFIFAFNGYYYELEKKIAGYLREENLTAT